MTQKSLLHINPKIIKIGKFASYLCGHYLALSTCEVLEKQIEELFELKFLILVYGLLFFQKYEILNFLFMTFSPHSA